MSSIRSARAADADAISILLGQLQHPSSPDFLRRRIQQAANDDREYVLVAVTETDQVVGVLALQLADQFHEAPQVARILDLCILESQRGQNYGRQLFSKAEEIAKKRGCCCL